MIVSPFTTSPILQTMLIAIVSLAAVCVAGLVYPLVRGRGGEEEDEAARPLGREHLYYYGTRETLERLKRIKDSGQFSQGVVIAYRALRNMLPKVGALSANKGSTELEIINEMIRTSSEMRDLAQSIIQAYEYYERARFARPMDAKEFDAAIAILDGIYSSPRIGQKPRGS